MVSVYHVYKAGEVLLCLRETHDEAEQFVMAQYSGRFVTGKDRVEIRGSQGVITSYEVDWMAQFEPIPGMVWKFPSSSGSAVHTTQVNSTGIVSCGCPAWTKGFKKMEHFGSPIPYRHCKHTTDVIARQGLDVEVKGQYLFIVDQRLKQAKQKFAPKGPIKAVPTTPQEKFAMFIQEYEDAIAYMATLEPNQMMNAVERVQTAQFKVEGYLLLLEDKGIDGTAAYEAAQAKLLAAKGMAMS